MRNMRCTRTAIFGAAVGLALIAGATGPALASGGGGGGGGGGGSSAGCVQVAPESIFATRRFSSRPPTTILDLFVYVTITNCDPATQVYTMRLTDVSNHINPLCSQGSRKYSNSMSAGETKIWGQFNHGIDCSWDYYTMNLDVLLANRVLSTTTFHWGTAPSP